jgi:hypothetical protein
MYKHLPMPPSSRILFVSATLVIVSTSFAALAHYGLCFSAPIAVDNKPKVGVVNGVVYSPGSSCAVVDGAMVREGDVIGDIAVVGIQDNAVAFSKAGVNWQQEVNEMPHEAWTDSAPPKAENVAADDGK